MGGFDSKGQKAKTIYELKDNQWQMWSQTLPYPMANDTVVQIQQSVVKSCKSPAKQISMKFNL